MRSCCGSQKQNPNCHGSASADQDVLIIECPQSSGDEQKFRDDKSQHEHRQPGVGSWMIADPFQFNQECNEKK